MNSRTSFHGDSLFDQTNRLAMDSLANHQFPTFGHKTEDTHRGIILHSGGQLPAVRAAQSLAARQHTIQVQHQMQIQRMRQEVLVHQKIRQLTDSLRPLKDTAQQVSKKVEVFYVKKKWNHVNYDYRIWRNGKIHKKANGLKVDRFGIEDKSWKKGNMLYRSYKVVAILAVNEYGLVNFPASSPVLHFGRYGDVQESGWQKGEKKGKKFEEYIGEGDHYLLPETAAALFGVLSDMNRLGIQVKLGDMSTNNGSDPGTATFHHGGHGHMGKRAGLDVDFRYISDSKISYQGTMNQTQFGLIYNEAFYESAYKYGFDWNNTYQGKTNLITATKMPNGSYRGVKTMGGHDNHGHLGFQSVPTNIIDDHEIIRK